MIELRRGCGAALLVYGVTLMLLSLVGSLRDDTHYDTALVVFGVNALVVFGVTLVTSRGVARITRSCAQLVAALAFARVVPLAHRYDCVWILVIGAMAAFALAHVIEPRLSASASGPRE
ncbi:MAG: hypothetical protein ABI591_00015 [Kofleriaceae bacterium]